MTSPNNGDALTFRVAQTRYDLARCFYLRTFIFIVGQNVPPHDEMDENEDACRHILGLDDGVPCAVARWRVYEPGTAKVERYGVHPGWQGKGVGKRLMDAVLADIAREMPGARKIVLSAQDHAIPFYERCGFTVQGDGYMDANIPHHWMEKAA